MLFSLPLVTNTMSNHSTIQPLILSATASFSEQAPAEVIDHPSAWLDILNELPFLGTKGNLIQVVTEPPHSFAIARIVNIEAPVLETSKLQGSRRFGLMVSVAKVEGYASFEFGIKATADQVEVSLSLLMADELALNSPELAKGGVLKNAMTSLMSSASRHVVAPTHWNLSPDLAETQVTLCVVMPSAPFSEFLEETEEALKFAVWGINKIEPDYKPNVASRLADAITPSSEDTSCSIRYLTTAQRLALALNLSALRDGRGLSQLNVADQALGLTKSHAAVSRLERGILAEVDIERLELLAKFFDTDVEELLYNRLTSGEQILAGEGEGLALFDPKCDFTPSVDFGSRIKVARTAAGLSHQALATMLNHLHSNTVCTWETEAAQPHRSSFIDLAIALNVPVSWLMFGRRVGTPARGVALRLTAMQKLYGLTNGEVGSLMTDSSDETELQYARQRVSRFSIGTHEPTPELLERLATALQVPADWLAPPNPQAESTLLAKTAAEFGAEIKLIGLSKAAKKLLTDLAALIEMGAITDKDIRTLRTDLVTRYTTPFLTTLSRR